MKPTLTDILKLEGADFETALYDYFYEKRSHKEALDPIEQESWLLMTMLMDIQMAGLVDLFYQRYSLSDCATVQAGLRKLGLTKLASLFEEAFLLYVNGKTNLTESDYRDIDPFGKSARWEKFDAIGEEMLAEGSEIFHIDERLETYVKAHLR